MLLALAGPLGAAEVGLVTAASDEVQLSAEGKTEALKAFVKLRPNDRLSLGANSHVQIVYFNGGRQENWRGAGQIEIGATESRALAGELKASTKTLPRILVKQLAKTPSPDGNVKTGMVRMRSMPSGGTLESVEKNYRELRQQAEPDDNNPELYLLAGYFELREFDKLQDLLKDLDARAPSDLELKVLNQLYARAMNNARMADK
jgi:hypothetical protein